MIRIFTKNTETEINVIKNTLKIRTENDAFSTSVKVYHNKYPFLISEDKYTIAGLGNKHLLSTGRNQTTDVVVQFNKKTFFGKLKVLEYVNGARKCDLRFGSDLLSISDKKIATFMPTHYFGDIKPYTETVTEYFEQTDFLQAIEAHSAKQYPDVNFALPLVVIQDFYKQNEELYFLNHAFNYRNFIGDKSFILNTRDLVFFNFYRIINNSSFVPMPYLISLLEIPLASIGWQLKGDYKEDKINSKIIIIPEKTNNTLLRLNEGYNFTFLDFGNWINIGSNPPVITTWLSFSQFITGTHTIKVDLKGIKKPTTGLVWLRITKRKENDPQGLEDVVLVDQPNLAPVNNSNFSTEVDVIVNADSANSNLIISYSHPNSRFPTEHNFTVTSANFKPKEMILFHPTVDLGRFVPDWTFIELINNLKEFQNLNSSINETTKTLTLNYNQKYITNFNFVNITEEAVRITNFKNIEDTTYEVIFADQEPSTEEYTTTIKNKFKVEYSTLDAFKKEGVTLALYENGIFTTPAISGKTLLLDNSNNSLLHLNFKDWFSFLKNASEITAVAYLSATTIDKIEKSKKIYFDKIMYAVKKMTYEVGNQLNKVTFTLNNILGVSSSSDSLITPKSILISNAVFVPANGVFGGSFFPQVKVDFTTAGFAVFNGNLSSKRLTQSPSLGIVYLGPEINTTDVLDIGTTTFTIPLTEDNAGWQEIQINYQGVFSNKFYLDLTPDSDPDPIKIQLTQIFKASDILNKKGYFSISFNGISPSSVTLSLQEVQLGTGFPTGAPITSVINNFTPLEHEITSPYSGSWTLKATAGSDTSNSISWLAIVI